MSIQNRDAEAPPASVAERTRMDAASAAGLGVLVWSAVDAYWHARRRFPE